MKQRKSYQAHFVGSAYFNLTGILCLSLFASLLLVLYPSESLLAESLSRPWIHLVIAFSMSVAFVVIVWVRYISYVLDQKYPWEKSVLRRFAYQFICGGIVSGLIIGVAAFTFYGKELFVQGTYRYDVFVMVILLYMLNHHSFVIYHREAGRQLEEESMQYIKEIERLQAIVRNHQGGERDLHTQSISDKVRKAESTIKEDLLDRISFKKR